MKAASADFSASTSHNSGLRLFLRKLRQSLRRFSRGGDHSGGLEQELAACVERKDWPAARSAAEKLGMLAESRNERGMMKKAGRALRRLDRPDRAWEILSKSKLVDGQTEWDGSSLAGKTLLVERREGDMEIFLVFASLLARVAEEAERCVVVVEPRIAPLYRRTFSKLDIRNEGDAPMRQEADVFASFETLAVHGWSRSPSSAPDFTPLAFDQTVARSLRDAYRRDKTGPLIGIAWGSLNKAKGVPSLDDWASMLKQTPGTIVSIQYGNVKPSLDVLSRELPGRVISDPTVDQLVDMDRFAAQLAALDGIVTISNTGAHLAGALGLPCVLVIDDGFHLSWPVEGANVPYYPKMTIVRRNGRVWGDVLTEARKRLAEIVDG